VWALLDGNTPGNWKAAVELNRDMWDRMSRGVGGEVRLMGDNSTDVPAKEGIAELPDDAKLLMDKMPDINLATIYLMAARLRKRGIPGNWTTEGTYQGFVQVNNLRLTPTMLATAAATLANAGLNPITGERLFTHRQVRYLLSTMAMAGMYDESGRWFFTVGLPAKSGVAGGLMVVAPGVGGFASISEPLNEQGNSARGVAFFEGLSHRFPLLHIYTPGSGGNPNLELKPDKACKLKPRTIQEQRDKLAPR